jgi:hypothetical protein
MTDLERFAAALLTQWRSEGSRAPGPIAVADLIDRVLPYRLARRTLGIDVSEDYEAMVLRLVAEEQGLVHVDPPEAGEMARTTLAAKLPDLDVLKLLRSATLTLSEEAIERLDDVLPMPVSHDESKWAAPVERGDDESPPDTSDIIPLPVSPALAAAVAEASAIPEPVPVPAGPPPEFLTTVAFTPPVEEQCWSCREPLPVSRPVKFCPFCGADQRQPACPECAAPVELRWKHCPECGTRLRGNPA